MSWSIERKTQIGFALAITLAAILGVVSYRTLKNQIEDGRKVAQNHEVLEELASTLSTMVELQAGMRGFVISGDERLIEPPEAALALVEPHLSRLQALTALDLVQQERIPALRKRILERMDYSKLVVEVRRTQGLEGIARIQANGSGAAIMGDIRRMIAVMTDAELASRRLHLEKLEQSSFRAELTVLSLALLIIVLILIGYHLIRRELKGRGKVQRRISAQYETARVLADSSSLAEATTRILKTLGESHGWDFGAYWTMDRAAHTLRVEAAWQSPVTPCAAFEAAARQTSLNQGVGFIRTVWTTAQPRNIPDITKEPDFRRAQSAADDGLRAAIAFPITLRGEVVGVMEFYSRRLRDPDDYMMKTASVIGNLIGQFADHMQGVEDLKEANDKLAVWVQDLEKKQDEITLLSQLGSVLQTCLTVEEAYKVIGEYGQKLFPRISGAVFVVAASRNMVEAVAQWGDATVSERVFPPHDCWALRSGRPNSVEEPNSAMLCRHTIEAENASYLCIPMMAQGESLGLLHLRWNLASSEGPETEWGRNKSAKVQLALAVAEHIGLALANVRLRDALRAQSIRDPLTDLFNRRYMEESLPRELRRALRSGRPLGIVMLDIDHFKRYNDTFGHEAGDSVLRELGIFLRSDIRGGDIACRFGGEEFILILPDATLEVTRRRADKLREGARHLQITYSGQPLGTITLSLGVSVFPDHGTTANDLVNAADKALYLAKKQGRNQVVVWEEVLAV